MLRSMFTGVSGMRSHMDKMDVISNNIANVNTTGFKGSRATFKTTLSQTMQGASAPQDGRGGTNPQQVGLGVSLGSVDKNMTQGAPQSTGINTDLAIDGNGFFVVNSGTEQVYTRAGSTGFDRDGYMVNTSNGYRMKGWVADDNGNIDTNGSLEDITLRQSMEALATDEVNYDANLSADSQVVNLDEWDEFDTNNIDELLNHELGEEGNQDADDEYNEIMRDFQNSIHNTTIDVYDSQGKRHNINVAFVKTGTNEWQTFTKFEDGDYEEANEVQFNEDGIIESGDTFTLNQEIEGVDDLSIELDFSSITQFAGVNSVKVDTLNGYQAGSFQSFDVDNSGIITGYYDNGQRQTLGRVAIASFNNPGGLSEVGDTLFRESNNSGIANIDGPGAGGRGVLMAGTLEMSNVDMAAEFTEMITTQRGFQGNSRTISTSDELLQELVNLKR
ncbi:flagellar hook protein FlgE [Halonatronum saccharophilum]|uniref:flagellar hook protein FlgE n=1 Tax=Halonatronum saccharophilum TaxID=150060 RepID=UPI000484EA96|nr:flagellar hook protein FlgE [Halonatronum saccharophilum]